MLNPLAQRLIQFIKTPPGGRVAELGFQTWEKPNGEKVSAEQFYKALGWQDYTALDIDAKFGALPLDLNYRPGEVDGFATLFGIFDLVTNNGTGEHIFDQSSVFQWCHDLCKQGGIMLHVLPWHRWHNHGFYSFHPIVFRDLAQANGYAIEAMYCGTREGRLQRLDTVPHLDPFQHPKPHKEPLSNLERTLDSFGERANVFVAAFLKKTTAEPFRVPIQGKYAGEKARPGADGLLGSGSGPTVLQRGDLSVVPTPFPHLVARAALPTDLYAALEKAWPDWSLVHKKRGKPLEPNALYQMDGKTVTVSPDIDPMWRKFFLRHLDAGWYQRLMEVFGPHLGDIMAKLPSQLSLGVRGTGTFDLVLDCQFAVNSPSDKPSSVRGPHIDSPDEILAGLFYMPVEGDNAGGDLVLYKWKDGTEKKLIGKAEVDPALVEPYASVPYEPNTLVLFVNGADAIHGVTERKPSPHPRRYINFVLNAMKPVAWEGLR